MELSLTKLPWYAQVGAFVAVSIAAVFAFWKFYVVDIQADIASRQARLTTLRTEIAKGTATARRLPEFQGQVNDLERRLDTLRQQLPEEKDVADILRRVQGIATQSNLTIQRFTPQDPKPQAMYAELPIKLQAEGTYHNLGFFFDRVSKFPRIINIGDLSIKAKPQPTASSTIVAELVATTFVLQEKPTGKQPPKGAAKPPAK